MINVMVVDDHDLVRTGIVNIVSASNETINVVADFDNGESAIEFCKNNLVHVVLLDLNMPNLSGIEVAKKLLRVREQIKIVVLTAQAESPLSKRLLGSGVMGYVTKNASANEIVQAIQSVFKGDTFLCSKMAKIMALSSLSGNHSPIEQLSPRELEVLIKIAQGRTNAEIINELNVSPKTISTHRSRITTKLGVRTDVELAKIAMRHGLVDQTMT